MAFSEQDVLFMREALRQAGMAYACDETPVGAVLVWEGEIIAAAYNRRETDKSALAHAECLAIGEACRKLGGWRLHKATLYVTLEPCPMCAGAIINARIARVVYGANDPKAGCCGSVTELFSFPFNHRPIVESGLLEDECRELLTGFFREMRAKRKALKTVDATD